MNKITISDLNYIVEEKTLTNEITGGIKVRPYVKAKGYCAGGKCKLKGPTFIGIKISF